MITMTNGKRIHRINLSVDDETLTLLTHLAMMERKDLTTYVGHLVEEHVHGVKLRIPTCPGEGDENHRNGA